MLLAVPPRGPTLGGYDEAYSQCFITLSTTNVLDGNNDAILFYASSGWQVSVSAVSLEATLGHHQPLNISLHGYTAIMSNPMNYISVPPNVSDKILVHLGIEERDDVNCKRCNELPNLTVSFATHGAVMLTPWQYLIDVDDAMKGRRCILPFSSIWLNDGEENTTDWIALGRPLLGSLYSVFDIDEVIRE